MFLVKQISCYSKQILTPLIHNMLMWTGSVEEASEFWMFAEVVEASRCLLLVWKTFKAEAEEGIVPLSFIWISC